MNPLTGEMEATGPVLSRAVRGCVHHTMHPSRRARTEPSVALLLTHGHRPRPRWAQPMWDYRIKVDPWQVFGTVELDVMGSDIVVEHVWAANVLGMSSLGNSGPHGGVRVKIELDMLPQDDQQFDIDGTGTPSSNPAIVRCANLEPPEYDCKLGAKYTMLNSFESRVSSKVHLDTWQEGAKVTVDFGTSKVKISEVWGAR